MSVVTYSPTLAVLLMLSVADVCSLAHAPARSSFARLFASLAADVDEGKVWVWEDWGGYKQRSIVGG